jgi:ubiquinone/menaquinone biosynthesis C-methylase UbiE
MEGSVPTDLKPRLAESYNAIAKRYNEWTEAHHKRRHEQLDKLLSLLTEHQKQDDGISILELGCGAGTFTSNLLLSSPKVHVTANDISKVQLELAKSNIPAAGADITHVTFVEADMMSLSFQPNFFDAIIGFYSLIHLPREEQTEMIKKIKTWLKPGGLVLANFSAEEIAEGTIDEWLGEKTWMYWSGWGAERTAEIFKETGLDVVQREVLEDVVDASFIWILARKVAK